MATQLVYASCLFSLLTLCTLAGAQEKDLPISEETTLVTGPIAADGWPDYVAAIVASRKKYRPEDNAAILFWRAIGSGSIDEAHRQPFFGELGCDVPARDETLVTLDSEESARQLLNSLDVDVSQNIEAGRRLLKLAQHRILKPSESGFLAAWNRDNRHAIDLLIEASQKEGFYSPPVNSFEEPAPFLLGLLLPDAHSMSAAVGSMTGRAMLELSAGRKRAAWNDINSAFRLIELYDRGDTFVSSLVAIRSQKYALRATLSYLGCSDRIEEVQPAVELLNRLSGESRIESSLFYFEQLSQIDFLTRCFSPDRFSAEVERPADLIKIAKHADPNAAFGYRFELAKQMRSVFENTDRVTRRMAAKEFDARFKAAAERSGKSPFQFDRSDTARQELGRRLGMIVAIYLIPEVESAVVAEDSAFGYWCLTQIAVHLKQHRIRHGNYPANLAELHDEIPSAHLADPFTDQPFRYERRGDGFVLYSLGPNGIDDNASDRTGEFVKGEYAPIDWFGERAKPDGPDDIVIRLPVPELELPRFSDN